MNDTSPHNQQVAGLVGLPDKPGIYIMKDRIETVIYIGKAKNLKNRVKQYFQKGYSHSTRTTKLLEKIKDINTISVDSDLEAILLVNNLIKQLKPKYNVIMKDDKNFVYIKIISLHIIYICCCRDTWKFFYLYL